MAENNTYIRYALVLGSITLACSLGVALVYSVTKTPILIKQAKVMEAARKQVAPDATDFRQLKQTGPDEGPDDDGVFAALDEKGQTVGYVALGRSKGYGGEIQVIAGVDAQIQKVTGVKVLGHSETPGLGAKLGEVRTDETVWSRLRGIFTSQPSKQEKQDVEPWFQEQFREKTYGQLQVVKSSSPEAIEALTAATITSVAVTDAVKHAVERIRKAVEKK